MPTRSSSGWVEPVVEHDAGAPSCLPISWVPCLKDPDIVAEACVGPKLLSLSLNSLKQRSVPIDQR